MHKSLGKFIVFEGVEGCGKTTQIQRVGEWLQSRTGVGHSVVLTREPGGTPLGLGVRELLLDGCDIQPTAELLLYSADRSQHVQTFIKPQLAQGTIVLCDRFTDSTVAYQGYGRGLSLSLIEQLNHIATGGLQSDLTLWLDLDVEVGLARTRHRGPADRMERTNLEFHRRVQQGYAALAIATPKRIVRVDASGSLAAVQAQIQNILLDFFSLKEKANEYTCKSSQT